MRLGNRSACLHLLCFCVLVVALCVTTGLVLVLANLCLHMETSTVPLVVELLAGAFQGSSGTPSDGPPRFVGGEVARRVGHTASELWALQLIPWALHGC